MLPLREEVAKKDCWDIEKIYPTFADWEKELKQVCESDTIPRWPSLDHFKEKLKTAEDLKNLLTAYFKIERILKKLYTYAHLRFDENLENDQHKKAYGSVITLFHDFETQTSWIEPEILQIPIEQFEQFLKHPVLEEYRVYLEKIGRLRDHTLSAKEEKLLSLASLPLGSTHKTFSVLNDADFSFGKIQDKDGKSYELTNGLYQIYLRSHDRILRKNAFETLHGQYLGFENTFCELLQGQIQGHDCMKQARKYSSCLQAALFVHNIDLKVYHNLLEKTKNSIDVLHEYIAFRKKILKVEELQVYDLYAPLVSETDFQFSYEEACALVIESVNPLGEKYQAVLEKGLLKDRWVDPFENQKKRSGAYSSGCYDTNPYILMNFHGTLNDVLTLAHEAGHSMHSYLSRENQNYQNSEYPIFVAEVASTFNELLLLDLLLKKTKDKKKKAYLINYKIEGIRTTFFRQTMFAQFELMLHEWVEKHIPLTPKFLKDKYLELNAEVFGKTLKIDEKISIEWARIPHFYYRFYVYQYATGISAAYMLVKQVLSSHEAQQNYLKFLSSGGSKFPLDLLKIAGCDLKDSNTFDTILNEFEKMTREIQSLLIEEDLARLDSIENLS